MTTTRTPGRRRATPGLLAMAAAAAALPGCAMMYTIAPPRGGPVLVGDIEPGPLPTGPIGSGCDGFAVELAVGYNPVESTYPGGGQLPVGYLAGRAITPRDEFRASRAERAVVDRIQPYRIEGDIFENGTALLTLYRETIIVPVGEDPDARGAKPFSIFRGTLVGNRLDAIEEPPSCGRRLVAEVARAPGEPVPAAP